MIDAKAIEENLARVQERIAMVCAESGRDPSAVRLIAVSKKQPLEAIHAAYAAGQRDFGENYAQDFDQRAESLRELTDLRWHFIGHLQRNKAKLVAPYANLIHAVDSAALITQLDRLLSEQQRRCDLLIQVNVTGEASKSGIAPETLDEMLGSFSTCKALTCTGLMTMAELDADPEPAFHALRELRDTFRTKSYPNVELNELSMGMTGDYETAIRCGSTMVRVGTAIFGPRN